MDTVYVERSIPARAGETALLIRSVRDTRVHPRACGGNSGKGSWRPACRGPSPRVRGKPAVGVALMAVARSIPARAGETLGRWGFVASKGVHPRACGGNHRQLPGPGHLRGPSPRVRGKRRPGAVRERHRGSIPARAGETLGRAGRRAAGEVHPRACGGNSGRIRRPSSRAGPSPRVRGKPRRRPGPRTS